MKTSAFAQNMVSQEKRFSLVVDHNDKVSRGNLDAIGIAWYLYLPFVVLTYVLFMPPVHGFFLDTGWRWVHVLALSFSLSFCLNPMLALLAHRLGMLDRPDARKLHQEATPLLGGAAVFIGFLAALLTNGIFSLELGAILLAAFILFAAGVIDDYKEISAGLKLGVQVGCTLLVIGCGISLRVIPVYFGIFALLGNMLLTFLWIIGITNAMNFFDGMDGLAAGLGALISLFLGIVAFQTHQPFLGWVAVAMLGGCLGFLPFNFKRQGNAAIFLGDAGSTVIGFILACVAVYGDWAEGNPVVALVSPILLFWLLIFDMIHITVERILTGKVTNFKQWIEFVGEDHLHHRLAHILGGKKKSVLFIYLLSICLGVSAVVLRNARPVDAV
jgi:UDP-GlcNAc:undecaprenyl-phosphate GlcNAc-1-phosphate transferase